MPAEDNIKQLKQLSSGFTKIIDWNEYQSKLTGQGQNIYFDYLLDSSFQGVNKFFILLFENRADRTVHTGYYIPKVEIKDYNIIIVGINFFDQPIKNDLKIYDIIRKIATVQRNCYTTGCFLDNPFFTC